MKACRVSRDLAGVFIVTIRDFIINNQQSFWDDLHAGDTRRSFISTLIARINDPDLHPTEYLVFGIDVGHVPGISIMRCFWAMWEFVRTLDATDEVLNHVIDAFISSSIEIGAINIV